MNLQNRIDRLEATARPQNISCPMCESRARKTAPQTSDTNFIVTSTQDIESECPMCRRPFTIVVECVEINRKVKVSDDEIRH